MATTTEQTNTITPDQLKPVEPIKTVNTPIDTANYAGMTGGVADSILNEYTNLNNQLTKQQESQNQTGTSIIDSMNALLGKTTDTQIANEQAGVNTETANLTKYAQQLADLNAQATSLNREAQAIPIQTQQNLVSQGRIASDVGIAPENAGALRLNALKALSIAQQSDIAAAAATGSQLRLQAAKDKAQQIVDLKYKPLEDALAIKKQQYELNKDLLSSIDKKRTEALNLSLQKEERVYNDTKAIATEAAKNGAPLDVINAITNAKDYKEAIKASGAFLRTPTTDVIKLDNGQTMLIDKVTGKVIKNFGGAKASSTGNSFAITENALKTTYNNDAVKQISAVIKASGVKPNQAMTDAINVIAGVQQMIKDNPTNIFKGLNPVIRLPGIIAGDRALTNRADIAAINLKVQQWASGAALTAQQTKQVSKMTPDKNDTDQQIRNKLNSLSNYMLSQVSGQLGGQGISFTSDKIDYFAPSSDEKLTNLYSDPSYTSKIEQAIQLYPDATADEILQIVE